MALIGPSKSGQEYELAIRLSADLKRLDAGLKQANAKIEELNSNFTKQSKQTGRSIEDSIGGSLSRIATMAATAFSAEAIINYGREAVNLAAQMEGVESAFSRIDSGGYLQDLRQATRGTVDDLKLMQLAVQANNFEIPLKNLGSLFDFARRRAKETGLSVDYLVNSIVTGIGRKSPLILDNLGISTSRLREELNGVGIESASVAQISEIMGSIATEEIEKMGDEAETTADKMQQISASLTNIKTQLGEDILEAGGGGFLGALRDLAKGLEASLSGGFLNEDLQKTYQETFKRTLDGVNKDLEKHGDSLLGLEAMHNKIGAVLEETIKEYDRYKTTAKQQDQMHADFTGRIAALEKALQLSKNAITRFNIEKEKQKKASEEAAKAVLKEKKALEELQKMHLSFAHDMASGGFRVFDAGNEPLGFGIEDIVPGDLSNIENLDASMEQFFKDQKARLDLFNEDFQKANVILSTFGQTLTSAFKEGIENGLDFGDAMRKMLENLVKDLIAATMSSLILSAIIGVLLPGSGMSFGRILASQLGMGGFMSAGNAINPGGGGGGFLGFGGGGNRMGIQLSGQISGDNWYQMGQISNERNGRWRDGGG